MGIRILSTLIVWALGANLAFAQGSPTAPADSRASLSAGGAFPPACTTTALHWAAP